jgi:exoribonuclease-2
VIFQEREEYSLIIENKVPVGVNISSSTLANYIVEEAMLISNKLFAEFAIKENLNVLFNTNSGFKLESKEDIEEIIKDGAITLVNDDLFSLENVVHIQRMIQEKSCSSSDNEKLLAEGLLNRLRRCFCKSEIKDISDPHKIMGVIAYATWTSPLRKSNDMINHIALKLFLLGRDQREIDPEEIESINERLGTSRQAERQLSKLLFTKLFMLNPRLVSKGKVINVRKFMTTIEIQGCGQYSTLQIRNIKSKERISADLDTSTLMSGKRSLFKNGDIIDIEFHSGNLIHQDIELSLTVN